jgi:DNA modification methylase
MRPANPLGKLPGSVWTIPTQPLIVPEELGINHFAAFPMEWPRRIIRGWSPEGGVVLDPFGGTGTTALVAHALGRHGISVDLSADYCRLARWRTSDPGEIARAKQQPKPKPVIVPDGQGTLQ